MIEPTIILLAAGCSRRLGSPKQLVTLGQQNLLLMACHQALNASSQVCVVLGYNADEMVAIISHLPIKVLVNEDWNAGLSNSLKKGLNTIKAGPALIMLCDQPKIPDQHYQRLISEHKANPEKIVASEYAGQSGVPAVFPRATFAELQRLSGDMGARKVIQNNRERLISVHCSDAQFDLDTPEDLNLLKIE